MPFNISKNKLPIGILGILRQSPSGKNLQRLFLLRIISITLQIAIFYAIYSVIELDLPWFKIVLIITIFTILNFLTWLRLLLHWPVTNLELFGQLLLDVAALTALLYFSGGSTNPFISLYLIPLTIAATVLPWHYTWIMAAITISSYTYLLFHFVPLPHDHFDDHGRHMFEFSLHVSGMWLTFVVSTLLIAWFVVKMNASIRDRDKALSQSREQALQNEQIVALGTLAAGAAHELGTPLSTMAIIAGELQHESADNPELQQNISILRNQITHCKQILTQLLADAGQTRVEEGNGQPVDLFLKQVIDKWRLIRPSVRFNYQCANMDSDKVNDLPIPTIMNTRLLSQSILNLLNNAADASVEQVNITVRWDQQHLQLEIQDDGPGLNPEAIEHAGELFFTSKGPGQGFGIGLFLANTNIERFGGNVRLFNCPEGGACTQVTIPVLSSQIQTIQS